MLITIARQCGCGALHVGEILSKDYGLKLYTRKSLMEKALREGMLEDMENFFEELPVDDLMDAITDYNDDRTAVRERFRKAFNKMIGSEDCVVIGRCGNYIFRERKDLTSIFLHGDIKSRINNICSEEQIPIKYAEEFVRRTDECRISYHKFYTGLDWGNAPDYNLCLDSCLLGAEKSAELIENFISML